MIVIENAIIDGLAMNDKVVSTFPFLLQLRTRASAGCNCGARSSNAVDYNQIKLTLAHLPGASQVKFKQLTGWDKVKIIYVAGSGTNTVIF